MIFRNKKASHEYHFVSEIETGIVLVGTEVKSIRAGKVNFKDSYARLERGEIWLYNLHIGLYKQASIFNHEPERKRKLLLHKREIRKLSSKVEERGMTLVPVEMYFNEDGKVKVKLALAKGKRLYDKRETLQRKDQMREQARRLKDL